MTNSLDSSSASLLGAIDEFNEYAKNRTLDIKLNVEVTKFDNPSDSYENFKSLVEATLKKSNNGKSNNKYDMYFYSCKESDIYGPYLLNLYDVLEKEDIEVFDQNLIQRTCMNNGKLVGMVRLIDFEYILRHKIIINI